MSPRLVELQHRVLEKNERDAQDLRRQFEAAKLCTLNLLSSPGSGKTALLERTLTALRAEGRRVAALVGDLETDNDARRLARSGAPVRQIRTAGNCHLEAAMIAEHLRDWDLHDLEYLFIENVGNLVCPAGYDLGEQLRVVLLSVTEGEDKPLKYPAAFSHCDLVLITKCDLAAAVEFDRAAALANISAVHPGVTVLETAAKTGQGMSQWLAWLNQARAGLAPRRD